MVIKSKRRRRQSKSNENPQIQFLSKHQRPIQNSNPTLHKRRLLRAFVASPITATTVSDHLLHLLASACSRERQSRHVYLLGAGPGRVSVVTVCTVELSVHARKNVCV